MRVVCLKQGDKYGAEYVNRLVAGLRDSGYRGPIECFTEDSRGIERSDLRISPLPAPEAPGWWGKLGLFRRGLWPEGERVLFLDLDTVVTGPIDDLLALDAPFLILRDFFFPQRVQSAVMSWVAGTMDYVWRNWELWGKPMPRELGDQDWIQMTEGRSAARWQDFLPGQLVSWKAHCQHGIPEGARLVCFHGKPRPHEVNWGRGLTASPGFEVSSKLHA